MKISNRAVGWLFVGLLLLQMLVALASWIVSSVQPSWPMRSLLTGDGLRSMLGGYMPMLLSPPLAWILLVCAAGGVVVRSGIGSALTGRHRGDGSLRMAWTAALAVLLAMLGLLALASVPRHAPLRGIGGEWLGAAFVAALPAYLALAVTLSATAFGIQTGRFQRMEQIVEALMLGLRAAATVLVLYLPAALLWLELAYVVS